MKDPLLARIKTATREMAQAEGELGRVLKEMSGGARAEKTRVTTVVEAALANLKAARATVAELEGLLTSDE